MDSLSGDLKLEGVRFSAVWIGLAGHDRPEVAARLSPELSASFKITEGGTFKLGNDIDVLATAGTGGKAGQQTNTAIVLIAGTGSVCMRYTRDPQSPIGEYFRSGRSGGWGHLLGDEGGGYDIGRQAIRATLYALDSLRIAQAGSSSQQLPESALDDLSPLAKTVINHFGLSAATNYDLVSSVLAGGGNTDVKSMIAGVARLVLEAADAERSGKDHSIVNISPDIRAILGNGVAGLVRTVQPLLREPFSAVKATLILGGSLLASESGVYRTELLSELERLGIKFADVRVVKRPATLGANVLAQRCFGLKMASTS